MQAWAQMRAAVTKQPKPMLGWRRWLWPRGVAALAALFVALLLLDALLYQITLPIAISSDGGRLTIAVDGAATQRLPISGRIVSVAVPPRDPLIHEYQLDGTDSTNNFTLDPTYLQSIAATPYYRFYAWMRDLDGLSRWRDLCANVGATADASDTSACIAEPPLSGAQLLIPAGATQRISVRLQRPETPVSLALTMSDGSVVTVTLDRNDHAVSVSRAVAGQPRAVVARTFFPTDAAPFAAMTADFLVRLALWALALLGLICGGEWLVGLLLGALRLSPADDLATADGLATGAMLGVTVEDAAEGAARPHLRPLSQRARGVASFIDAGWRGLTAAIHPIGLLALAASFIFVVWIALAQYHAQPHIYDASAYLFGAKTFAAGRLFAPVPAAVDRFPGPFMLVRDGKWFTQYEPGAPLTLALGVALGAPWLVEPLLGTLALLGIGLIARRFYDRRVATLAVLLGVVSPFYSYLAASYLSHTIALFYLVWGFWALLRALDADRRGAAWYLPLAGLLWLMALLTRDTSAIFAAVATAGALWLAWRGGSPTLRQALSGMDRRRWLAPGLALLGVGALGLVVALGYNAALTGSPLLTPRQLFFPGDHYGFGKGVGFYGQHTLAAGFVTVDELLASLAINLYGWPFYLTLAFLLIPFLTRRARAADVVMLLGAAAMTFAFIGFYYHGIYLGPRYLFEALPFFLILTARGLVTLAEAGLAARAHGVARGVALAETRLAAPASSASSASSAPAAPIARGAHWSAGVSLTGALGVALLACLFGYFLPRQLALHTDFTGMDAGRAIQMSALDHPPLHHALVVTSDSQLYGYTLFGLNDPLLRGNVIYAEATSAADLTELHRAFPDRSIYALIVDADGAIHFIPLDNSIESGAAP